jgi:hypothetical protein
MLVERLVTDTGSRGQNETPGTAPQSQVPGLMLSWRKSKEPKYVQIEVEVVFHRNLNNSM